MKNPNTCILFLIRSWVPNSFKTKARMSPVLMWRCFFKNIVKLNLFQTVTGYKMELLHLPISQTARSFLVMWTTPALINFYQCSGPCNQREPICSGWLLIWPWPPASGLFCPSGRFGPGSLLEREKPSLEGFSYHFSHRKGAENWAWACLLTF